MSVSSCDVIDDVSSALRLTELVVAVVAAASRRKHDFLHERPTDRDGVHDYSFVNAMC